MRKLLPWTLAALVVGALALSTQGALAQVSVNPRVAGAPAGGVTFGTGGATGQPCGRIYYNVTPATQTDADTTEKDLWTYTLPANTLTADGMGIRLTASVTFGSNANTKSVRLYWNGVAVAQRLATTANGGSLVLEALIFRSAASGQRGFVSWNESASGLRGPGSLFGTGVETGPIVLKITGQNGTATAGDIVFRFAMIECL